MPPRHNPCENCRRHHVKCDNGSPKCSRCKKFRRECIRINLRNSHHSSNFTVRYIDETPKFTGTTTDPSPRANRVSNDDFTPYAPPTLSQPPSPDTSLEATHTPWLQIGPREACLLRYFVEELARWFDICDPSNRFTSTIPQRARDCLTLRHAILAASARHFSTLPASRQTATLSKYNMKHDITVGEETVLYYHNQCITDLRFLAAQPDSSMNENLLAAVVILRFYEELDNPFVTLPTETAARGLHVFIEAQAQTALTLTPASNSTANGTLRQAVFWTGFRQEFHMAFSQQRPFRLPLSLSVAQSHLVWTSASDTVWTNRLLIMGARVIQYCYDDTCPGHGSVAGYRELLALREKWVHSRPVSFSPVYVQEPHPGKQIFFPGIWYLDDCHIVASQSLGLLDILFAVYSPYIPRIGPALHMEMEHVNEKLRAAVLEICGIAVSNKQSAPALTTACIAVSICAESFVGCCGMQRALIDVVVDMGRELNYWPARVVQDRLEVVWVMILCNSFMNICN